MWHRIWILVLASLLAAGQAHADEPRHVRLLWDVSDGNRCVMWTALSETTFSLPVKWPCAGGQGTATASCAAGTWCTASETPLSPGDYVTVYAYRYNPVSYKPLASQVATVLPEEPVGITLLSGLFRAAGGNPGPAYLAQQGENEPVPPQEPISPCIGGTFAPDPCLDAIGRAVAALTTLEGAWNDMLQGPARKIGAGRRGIPAGLRNKTVTDFNTFGIEDLGKTACAFSVKSGKSPLGDGCTSQIGWLEATSASLSQVTELLRGFDASYTPLSVTSLQLARRDGYRRAVDATLEYLVGTGAGLRAETTAGVVQLAEDLATIKAYRRALAPEYAGEYAVELARQGPVKSLSTLVFTLPLRAVGAPDGAAAGITRSLAVEVAASRPWVLVSGGVMVLPTGSLGIHTLAVEQIPNGNSGLVRRLVNVEADTRPVTALLGTHFRVEPRGRWYLTAGTTADKDIFRTAILGASWFKPGWRSLLTVGVMLKKGSTKEQIDDVIDRYSTNGFVPDSINVSQIYPEDGWRWGLVVGWTLTPF
jgi:hypothetical protein